MTRLGIDEIREVHGKTGLRNTFDEAVWKAVDVQAVEGAYAVCPFVGKCQAVATDDLEAGAPAIIGADLEPGGENQAVERVFDAVDDNTALGDLLNAAAMCVDESNVVA